jgi:adenylate cyclase
MNLKKILLIFGLVLGFAACAQTKLNKDTATVNALIGESKSLVGTDSTKAVNLALQAKEIANEIKYPKGEAYALKNIGLVYYMKGKYAETLEYWNQSLQIFENLKDDVGISNMLNNIGAIYLNQGADDKALEYILKSLQLAEKIDDTLRIITALSNVGGIYYNKRDPVALNYLLKAIPLVESSGYMKEYVVLTGNIGEIYADNNDDVKALEYFQKSIKAAGNTYASAFSINGIAKQYLEEGKLSEALEYYSKALDNARKFDQKLPEVRSLRGIADVYIKQGDMSKAIGYYKQAQTIAQEMDDVNVELKDLYQEMASAYSKKKDFSNAFLYQSLYSNIKDSLYTVDTKKKLNQLQFDFELSKKESELSRKEVEINLADLQVKRQKLAKNAFMVGLSLVLMIALLIFRSYRIKVKTHKILDLQKGEIENLLLNILPSEVAKELQVNGYATPRNYESASVMFTDFKGFTTIADKMHPQELVEELNTCFIAFDNIIEKYGLEKIKTIGDSYMCAGGIPTPDKGHVINMIKASLEIKDYITRNNSRRIEAGLESWYLRIGIHVGPIVAGVVGKKKYAYDIWGSTVNIASRMESNGEPGKVNISSATYELIKDKYDCIYRGKIFAKNIGEIDMYFVEGEVGISKKETMTANISEKDKTGPLFQGK